METLSVLVCDDEMGMRMGVMRALRHHTAEMPDVAGEVSFEVGEAETGEQALELIEASPPHILLLDHKLPGISGIDVLDELAPKKLDMLTIMITAYASIETAVRATKQGAYDFLPKPFTPDELRGAVTKAAEHIIVARQARRLAEEKRRVRFDFIRVVAHELKSPINAIEGYLNVLASGAVDGKPEMQEQMIGRCVQRIGGMRKMITDLLDLTRIESGQKPRELEDVDVADIAQMALEGVIPEAGSRGITLNLQTGGPVKMRADRSEIEIILNNLVTNAVKYNCDGGCVDISVSKHQSGSGPSEIVIEVTDTGIGMTQEEVAKLFHDFVRIKSDKTQHILGSGLGLSILKKLANLYHGDVRVRSKPDKGSTFAVVLRDSGEEAAEAVAEV